MTDSLRRIDTPTTLTTAHGDALKKTDGDEARVMPTPQRWIADAVIAWPNNDSLTSIIEALQALNPRLGLRRAVDVRYGEIEYLL